MGNRFLKPLGSEYEYAEFKKADSLRVIGVGLPRTGTSSLKAALDILGLTPCHHMLHLFGKVDRIKAFIQAYDGEKIDFYELMKGYGSTVDAPTIHFYKEIQQAYPQAKLILTVRDSDEKWFQSYQNTIGSLLQSKFTYAAISVIRPLRLHYTLAQKCDEKFIRDYGEMGPLVHRKHNQQIINENKNNNLLVFNVREGWGPLCKFLEVDIPQDIPFPDVNDGETFTRQTRVGESLGTICWLFLVVIIVLFAYVIKWII